MRSNGTFRSSNRGSLMIDVGVALLVVMMMVVVVVPAGQNLRQTMLLAAGSAAIHSYVESDIATFSTATPGSAPSITPTTAGQNDAGESLQAIRSTSLDASLGLRTYSVAVFAPGTQHVAVGGGARFETLSRLSWRPDGAALPSSSTSHLLTLSPGNAPAMGIVKGSGVYAFGATVTISATAFSPYQFVSWSGSARIASSTSATTTVVIDEDRTLTAIFSP